MAFLPHGAPHTFQVLSPEARFTCITASLNGTPRFDRMVTALGIATDGPTLPDPMPIDPAEVAEICEAHGITILGPPPLAPRVNRAARWSRGRVGDGRHL